MRGIFSPARNVLSTTPPLSSALSLVRTKAPPLPGFTCWNSTMREILPSTCTCMPFLNSLVETVSAMSFAFALAGGDQVLRVAREPFPAVRGDDDQILDPDAADAWQVDARLHCDDHPGLEGC